jgi:hypothetical protein
VFRVEEYAKQETSKKQAARGSASCLLHPDSLLGFLFNPNY